MYKEDNAHSNTTCIRNAKSENHGKIELHYFGDEKMYYLIENAYTQKEVRFSCPNINTLKRCAKNNYGVTL